MHVIAGKQSEEHNKLIVCSFPKEESYRLIMLEEKKKKIDKEEENNVTILRKHQFTSKSNIDQGLILDCDFYTSNM